VKQAPIVPDTFRNALLRRQRSLIVLFCVVAFLLRVTAVSVWSSHFLSYTTYYNMAEVLVNGGGYCLSPEGALCAYFPPVYPTILAACILTGFPRPAIILVSSLFGAGTVWLIFLIGRRLFGPAVGLLASLYAAVYPYYVWHDGVIQESATLTVVVAAAILLLIRASDARSTWRWLAAGAMLGLAVLTKANLALFAVLALIWGFLITPGTLIRRLGPVLYAAIGLTLVMGPWVVRTWRVTGTPIIYSNGGFSLWTANHRLTFDYFPAQSIDAASLPEWHDLKPEEQREFNAISDPQGIRQTKWYWDRGMEFIRSHPWLTLGRAIYKIWIAFSPRFSPAKDWAFQTVYFVFWVPVLVLALAGAWRTRSRWRELGYVYMLILSFALGCAVFWGHTSHRMYIEPYLMMLAASRLVTAFSTDISAPVWGTAAPGKETQAAGASRSSASLRLRDV
jgi:4-amino-4-deoxy-L-arabinose transferase-like glycosyltransferase